MSVVVNLYNTAAKTSMRSQLRLIAVAVTARDALTLERSSSHLKRSPLFSGNFLTSEPFLGLY